MAEVTGDGTALREAAAEQRRMTEQNNIENLQLSAESARQSADSQATLTQVQHQSDLAKAAAQIK